MLPYKYFNSFIIAEIYCLKSNDKLELMIQHTFMKENFKTNDKVCD